MSTLSLGLLRPTIVTINAVSNKIDNIIIAGVIDGSDRKGFKTWWCGSDDYTVVED
jgi:hypothetical protein